MKKNSNRNKAELFYGKEPVWWNVPSLSEEQIKYLLIKSYNYYNDTIEKESYPKIVSGWMKHSGYNASDITKVSSVDPNRFQGYVVYLCKLLSSGCDKISDRIPYIKEHIESLLVKRVIHKNNDSDQTKKEDPFNKILADTDDFIDAYKHVVGSTSIEDFTKNHVPQKYFTRLKLYLSRTYEEIVNIESCIQLKEAYSCYTATQLRQIKMMYEKFFEIFSDQKGFKKPTKIRKQRAVSPEKRVAKLRYLKKDETLSLNSIDAIKILETKILWVYNTKTRKLGKYIAEKDKSLSIDGCNIINYDVSSSTEKLIRNPKEFFEKNGDKLSKGNLRQFFTEIKAKELQVNSKTSKDTILLRCYN